MGYGGLPNEEGVVQLDASVMDGRTYSAGSVASIENIMTPSSVARLVMERTDHVMLVGPGALAFAKSFGFKEENLLTEEAREIWIRWREQHSETDKWGPPEHLKGRLGTNRSDGRIRVPPEYEHGTTNVLAVDAHGDIAGITTTSGFAWKVPGRIGDSPIIGAGLYVDNAVGAAGATGRGEDVIKSCASGVPRWARSSRHASPSATAGAWISTPGRRTTGRAGSPVEALTARNFLSWFECAGCTHPSPPATFPRSPDPSPPRRNVHDRWPA